MVIAGRCSLLSETILNIEDSHPEHSLKRGPPSVHALRSSHIPDSHLTIRSSFGWEVSGSSAARLANC